MNNRTSTAGFGVVAAAMGLFGAFVPSSARADVITSLASVSAVQGGYAYVYDVQLSGGQLDPSTNYTDAQGKPVAPQFGTIYDFGPLLTNPDGSPKISYTGELANFTWTFNLSDTPAPQTLPIDNPALTNIRFIYNGTGGVAVSDAGPDFAPGTSYTTVSPGVANLGQFTIESPYAAGDTADVQYDGTSYKAVGSAGDTAQSNLGDLTGPVVPSPVPEPASLALLGSAMLGTGLLRRRT